MHKYILICLLFFSSCKLFSNNKDKYEINSCISGGTYSLRVIGKENNFYVVKFILNSELVFSIDKSLMDSYTHLKEIPCLKD